MRTICGFAQVFWAWLFLLLQRRRKGEVSSDGRTGNNGPQGYDGMLQSEFGGDAFGAALMSSFVVSRTPEHVVKWVIVAPVPEVASENDTRHLHLLSGFWG